MIDDAGGDSVETVLTRLSETIQWCQHRTSVENARDCLRSNLLRPNPLAGNRRAVVESVADSRYVQLKHPEKRRAKGLAGGRLLAYEPDLSLSHGIEEAETQGFVDVDNIPPWDTWVAYINEPSGENYLLSWVPGEFVPLVSQGILVSPEQCFDWIESKPQLIRILEDAGFTINKSG